MTTKPVYRGDFCAFSAADAEALRGLIRRAAKPGCRLAEVGSWLGNGSTQAFLGEMSDLRGARLLCVDTWKGSFGVKRHSDLVKDYDVLSTFRSNIGDTSSVDILIADSCDAASFVAESAFDLVFVDADHRYKTVVADIAAWLPKVKPGGIICGHDCETRPTPEIRDMLRQSPDVDSVPVERFKFAAVHPGAIIAVDEAFGGQAKLMSDTTASTIWFVER
ncbi:class I SAM-dependent methyltransferase [Bradyrhizobium daqingense]|uniref:Methyltransferase family protein n=1 Tax=Bradyrhizobium daqingense TaxID=993502 RepID=A0A562LUY8_9BRAD|nr:class I SAM-dependent methyltransferase [Bradyrhizobium daqingense]TWI11460.1 methyltransferase family protein [Bradyrhizobium daqingense]UFS92254.1 class I SAM-dependent methyltransferase [Bradyrhizobium daqingense]